MFLQLVCDKDVNKGIAYQYALPESNPRYAAAYEWTFLSWKKCSNPCGGGVQVN